MKYKVYVDDNSHYQDESERYLAGEYDTIQEAVSAARKIVDDFLQEEFHNGMTAEELYNKYINFGSDPFIMLSEKEPLFSAWTYAKEKCKNICG